MTSLAIIKRRARILVWVGLATSGAATGLATVAAMNGRWGLWAINGVLLLIASACTLVNLHLVRR